MNYSDSMYFSRFSVDPDADLMGLDINEGVPLLDTPAHSLEGDDLFEDTDRDIAC